MRLPALTTALLLTAGACVYPERELEGLDCSSDVDCIEGYRCFEGHCVDTWSDAGVTDPGAVDRQLPDTWVADTVGRDASAQDLAASPDANAGTDAATPIDAVVTADATSQADGALPTDATPAPDTEMLVDAASPPDTAVLADVVVHVDVPGADQTESADAASPDLLSTDAGEADPSDALFASFRCEETSGTQLVDAVGNLSGLVTGAGWDSQGQRGYGLTFDGDDAVQLSPSSALEELVEGTFSAWVKRTGGAGSAYIFSNVNAGQDPRLHLYVAAGNLTILYETWGGGGHDPTLRLEVDYPSDGDWHHVAYAADNTGNALFLDGVAQSPLYLNGEATDPHFFAATEAGTEFMLGKQWLGLLDEVRLYSRRLSEAEVRFDMENSLP